VNKNLDDIEKYPDNSQSNEAMTTFSQSNLRELLKQGKDCWNRWTEANSGTVIDFTGFDFSSCRNNDNTHDFSGFHFLGPTIFQAAQFGDGKVDFTGAKFRGGIVDFSDANFGGGDITFNRADFSDGNVTFANTKFGSGNVDFRRAKFGNGDVDFTGAEFPKGDIYFKHAEFGNGNKYFNLIKFGLGNVSFSHVKFGNGAVEFTGTKFRKGNVEFNHAIFGDGYVDFIEVQFGNGNVVFNRANFGNGEVNFTHATFGEGNVSFERAKFGEGNVYFTYSTFGKGTVNFMGAEFGKGDLFFNCVEFGEGDVSFSNAEFGIGVVIFNDSKFGNGSVDFRGKNIFDQVTEARFVATRFGSHANYFNQVIFICDVHFEYATFEGPALFIGVQFLAKTPTSFLGARFLNGLHIDQLICHSTIDLRNTEIKHHISLSNCKVTLQTELHHFCKKATYPEDSARFRRLKDLAVNAKDHEREQEFFSQELIASRFHSVRGLSLIAGYCYQWFSNFGRSLKRPCVALFILWLLAAEFFYINAPNPKECPIHTLRVELFKIITPRIIENNLLFIPNESEAQLKACDQKRRLAASISLNHLSPFSVSVKQVDTAAVISLYGKNEQSSKNASESENSTTNEIDISEFLGWPQFLSAVESLLALIFTFLLGLAIRNRFRI